MLVVLFAIYKGKKKSINQVAHEQVQLFKFVWLNELSLNMIFSLVISSSSTNTQNPIKQKILNI